MTVGIDIDDTMTYTTKKIKECLLLFGEKEITEYTLLEKKDYDRFLLEYLGEIQSTVELKPGVKNVIDYLKSKGHLIYIITYRNNEYNYDIESITKKYLKEHGINYDKIFFNAFNKGLVCSENEVDLMIDDKDENLISCKNENVKVLKIDDEKNFSVFPVAKDWGEVLKHLKKEGF